MARNKEAIFRGPIPRESIEIVKQHVRRLPSPQLHLDGRVNRQLHVLQRKFNTLCQAVAAGEIRSWKTLCELRARLESVEEKFYPGWKAKKVAEVINACIAELKAVIESSSQGSPVPTVAEAEPLPLEASKMNTQASPLPAIEADPSPLEIGGMIFHSESMREILRIVEALAQMDLTVLILGETGTGKELIARLLHTLSDRAESPFETINCAAIPSELLEAELFGAVRGAYTSAYRDRKGLFSKVGDGTLFLDEIGDMELRLQAKILRVLQEKEFRAVGSDNGCQKFAGRVVAATNRDLRGMMDQGTFRPDLFYRISDFDIKVPPLRERTDDIAPIVEHLLRKAHPDLKLTPEAVAKLLTYDFPGNVRELGTVLNKARVFAKLAGHPELIDTAEIHLPVGQQRQASS